MNHGSWQNSSHFKKAGRETAACREGADIQHMYLMSHCDLSYGNYDIMPRDAFRLLWQLTCSPSPPSVH